MRRSDPKVNLHVCPVRFHFVLPVIQLALLAPALIRVHLESRQLQNAFICGQNRQLIQVLPRTGPNEDPLTVFLYPHYSETLNLGSYFCPHSSETVNAIFLMNMPAFLVAMPTLVILEVIGAPGSSWLSIAGVGMAVFGFWYGMGLWMDNQLLGTKKRSSKEPAWSVLSLIWCFLFLLALASVRVNGVSIFLIREWPGYQDHYSRAVILWSLCLILVLSRRIRWTRPRNA